MTLTFTVRKSDNSKFLKKYRLIRVWYIRVILDSMKLDLEEIKSEYTHIKWITCGTGYQIPHFDKPIMVSCIKKRSSV